MLDFKQSLPGMPLVFMLLVGSQAVAEDLKGVQVVRGVCRPASHTAEGPINSDLTKRQSRFFCDTAVIGFFDDDHKRVMVQFVEKKSKRGQLLGYAGLMDDAGVIMDVQRAYLAGNSEPIAVSSGFCKFFFKKPYMSGIACGMAFDEDNRKTTAIVQFDAAPGQ